MYAPLFETKKAKGSSIYKLFATSIFVGIVFIWIYRATHVNENGRLAWIGMFGAEIWFGLYWILTQAHRWNRIYRQTFKDRLSQRYENDLPGVDIFVCTADPKIEPPMMVINTVLSFNVEPRSPEAHFRAESEKLEASQGQHLASVKKLYQVMENKIELATKLGRISKSALLEHKGFSKWDSFVSQKDHDAILQIVIDGGDAEAKDTEGCRLPTLVYLAREKRPQHFHNFKAGAMNALIRVSSEISNGPVILNLDCDMYSNNSQSIRDALCFFLDEEKSHEFAYVQFPQSFHNLTKNELYGGSLRVVADMGLKYGCPVEDVITGLSIQCRGWKSIYFNPERKGFLGVAGTTLDQTLVQHKRWSEGDLQIFLSKYSPIWYGLGRIKFGLIMGYCAYCLWSINCFATLYYSTIPALYLLRGVSLFPQVSSLWIIPFTYVIIAANTYSFAEYLCSGGTALGWWNEQRIWLYKRTSSYLLAVVDTFFKMVGNSDSGFVISAKVSDQDVSQRYEQEKMEFGAISPMFTILSSLALLNLFCLIRMVTKVVWAGGFESVHETMGLQVLLSGVLVLINLPLYNAAFFRKDKGRIPSSVTLKSALVALSLCTIYDLLW
ncbi:hypothetical protein DH2020_008727 [Rehmannia glutinosa]|uniref:Cellulose synthase-like protein n=1 Tax=Rehmannia glutinosa TaxID=99300 RepID=A0ABR0X4W3_REHGL